MATRRKTTNEEKPNGESNITQTDDRKKEQGPFTDYFIQSALLIAMLIPFFVAYVSMGKLAFASNVSELLPSLHLHKIASFPSNLTDLAKWALLMFSLSSPHVYYYIIWTNPKLWISFCPKYNLGRPVKVYAYWAHAIKAQQSICLAWWFLDAINYTFPTSFSEVSEHISSHIASMNVIRLILSIDLMILGQVFNVGVYQTIGESGVYYGIKFGEPVPWVFGFPFSVIGHPQYRGATITIWGILLFIATEVAVAKGLYAIGCVWATYYYLSGYVEEFM